MTTTVKPPRGLITRGAKTPKNGRPAAPGGIVLARASEPIEGLTLGGEPRVHLIPPAVLARKKGKDLRRRLGLGVVGVIVLVAVGLGLATLSTAGSQNSLTSAQQATASILQEQAKYGIVTKVKADTTSIQSSQKMATAQEILWLPFYSQFEKTLPSGASIDTITASLDNALGNAQQQTSNPSTPTSGAHIATVIGTVSMTQAQIAGWLNSLSSLTGFVDVTPTSVTGSGNVYAVSITMHINSDALANRFTKDAGTTK